VFDDTMTETCEPIGFRRSIAPDDCPGSLGKIQRAVARAKDGDQEALRFLYVSYAHNVYGYVRSIIRDEYEAEDVTQHVFAKLMTTLDKYDDRGVPFIGWLLRLAHNVAIDHLRANRLTPTDTLFNADASSGANLERPLVVRDALATLSGEQREVVILRHVVGLTPGEIARHMGRSESSIHSLHHRGRRALKCELERLESGPHTHAPPHRAKAA
jgi:RNA polymerase sigma-70 factor, ECF subfamily